MQNATLGLAQKHLAAASALSRTRAGQLCPFCTQVGHAGPLRESEPRRPIPYLDRLALEFPELRIFAGHVGAPWLSEMLPLLMKYPNVFVDTSAYKVSRYPKELVDHICVARQSIASCSVLINHSGRRANAPPVSTSSISGSRPRLRSLPEIFKIN